MNHLLDPHSGEVEHKAGMQGHGLGADDPVHGGLEGHSEKRLLEIGHRTIELISLQDLLKSTAPRFWRGNANRTSMHKLFILSGCYQAELVHQELVGQVGSADTLPRDAASHRLNLCLRNLGLNLLTHDETLHLRGKARDQSGKACLVQSGLKPLLVTAPHNIVLIRDEKPPHRMEEFTTNIAERMANTLGGSSLTWSRREQYRSELRWAVVKRRGWMDLPGNDSGLLDPSNRDPNFLATDEVYDNEWFQKMLSISDQWSNQDGCRYFNRKGRPVLVHLDVHGCKDPPHHEAHLNIGLGAIRQHLPAGPASLEKLRKFGKRLIDATSGVIESLNLEPEAVPVRVIFPQDPEDPPYLSGSWPPTEKRHTQTQQSMTFARFTHACQLEMSLALRKSLAHHNKEAIDRLAKKLWHVFETSEVSLVP